jgi:peptide chain release factor 2
MRFQGKLKPSGVIFEVPKKTVRIDELDSLLSNPEIWKDRSRFTEYQSERSRLSSIVRQWATFSKLWEDLQVMIEFAEEDESMAGEIDSALSDLEEKAHAIELAHILSGPDDSRSAFLEIHAGAGGTEAQDWAEMLLRMYLRWAESNRIKASIIDIYSDEEAGIKSVTVEMAGEWAFGYLKCETGVHRLVRISPFDANARRHTSFASVMVTPEVDLNIDVQIDEKELRIDTYRSSGHGGQHVNKTDSAVRITHLPTGIVVSCQNERSQHKNKAFCMKMLASKLYELEVVKQKERMDEFHREKKEIAWGSQIRSYVMQPYQMVKDHRTNLEIGNVQAVMDGEINPFIDAYLAMMAKGDKND